MYMYIFIYFYINRKNNILPVLNYKHCMFVKRHHSYMIRQRKKSKEWLILNKKKVIDQISKKIFM